MIFDPNMPVRDSNESSSSQVSAAKMIQTRLYRIEDAILTTILLLMLFLGAAQIFLRNFLDAGLPWGDALVRILVLWVGLLGAMAASRKGDHIKINLAARYLKPAWNLALKTVTDLFTATVCTVVFAYSTKFVYWEYQDGLTAFESAPVWIFEAIIPIAFFVMALRYLISALIDVRNLIQKSI